MPYLDTALAFALTMLAVSTLVTQIVRIGQYFAKLRTKVMKEMLNDYFTKELKPVVVRELDRLKSGASASLAAELIPLAEKLAVALPPIDEKPTTPGGQPPTPGVHPLFTQEEIKNLADLSTTDFVERLKRSEMGKKLLTKLGDKAEAVFDELGKRYEIVGDKFTKSFRENSRKWATTVALVVAFVLNIDSIFIVNTYINNESMRQTVIAQKDSLEQGYKTLAEQLEQDQTKTEITKSEFEQAFSDTKNQLDVFTSAGFPIGWSYFPHACIKAPEQGAQSPDCQKRNNTPGTITWFFGCILTGLLAGLGGPFWYDVVSGISRAIQSIRSNKKPDTLS